MSLAPVLAPKKPVWFRNSAIVGGLGLVAYIVLAWMGPWAPGRFWGLTFGTIAAALFVNAGLYPMRRRWKARPLGTVQRWMQLHAYGTTIALLFVLIHVGFRLPAGQFGWWLFGLSVWACLTGLLGVFLQKWIPIVIARNLKVEAIYDRIPELVGRLSEEADKTVAGAGDALSRTYRDEVKPKLAAPMPSWGYLSDIRVARAKLTEPLTRIATFVEEGDRERLRDLTSILNDKLDLDVHMSLQRALRLWLVLHVPAAIALLGLLVIHVFAVIYL
jgi:hypothetical protein